MMHGVWRQARQESAKGLAATSSRSRLVPAERAQPLAGCQPRSGSVLQLAAPCTTGLPARTRPGQLVPHHWLPAPNRPNIAPESPPRHSRTPALPSAHCPRPIARLQHPPCAASTASTTAKVDLSRCRPPSNSARPIGIDSSPLPSSPACRSFRRHDGCLKDPESPPAIHT